MLALACVASTSGPARAQQGSGLFGTLEFKAASLAAIPQWIELLARIETERARYAACDDDVNACNSQRLLAWRAKVKALEGRVAQAQLDEINRFANEIAPYLTDSDNYGVSDYWATPLEFLQRDGDCEDFAIIKFVSLLELGISNERLRIVVLMDTLRNVPHAVLAVDLDGRHYILDSLFGVVLQDADLPQYVPQYSVNMTTRWAHITMGN
jgi:predicted transglutaminase-like cysteine proteinase